MKFLAIVAGGLVLPAVACFTTKTVSTSAGDVVVRDAQTPDVLPAGATLHGSLSSPLSATSRPGDAIGIALAGLKANNGGMVIPAGSRAFGHVVEGSGRDVGVTFDSLVVGGAGGTMHVLDANILQTGIAGVAARPVVSGSAAPMSSVAVGTMLTFSSGTSQIPAGTTITLVVTATVRLKP